MVNPVCDTLTLRYCGTSRWRMGKSSWMYIDLRLRSLGNKIEDVGGGEGSEDG